MMNGISPTLRLPIIDGPRLCPRCAEPMEERQCKIVCRRCGASADCSDP
jgi:hypothetical protein